MNASDHDRLPEITLRVPGGWASPRELMGRLASAGTGYELSLADPAAPALVELATGRRFPFEIAGPDGEIAELFADTARMTDDELAALADHTVKAFVSGPGGSVEAARGVMRAAAALVRAGGLGVLVDNCGATHAPGDWLKLADDDQPGGVFWGLVALTGGADAVFSTGMHCLGFRDAELPDPPPDRQAAAYLLANFLGYSYQSGEVLIDGGPLDGWDGPPLVIHHVDCDRFSPDTPFHNPYGIWRLEPAEE
jgi:hypothetical protein